MLREALSRGEDEEVDGNMGLVTMFVLAVATSIDAFAVGISFAMDGTDILAASSVIGIVTFAISMAGMRIGSAVGDIVGNKADIIGGVILIIIAIKTALENLIFS